MATRTHEVKFPGDGAYTALDDYVLEQSMEIDEQLMNEDWRACKDVCRFGIQGYTSAIHNKFYSANDEILLRVIESGTTMFTGIIDPNYRQQVGEIMEPLYLEAEDNSYLLDELVDTSFTYPTLVGGTPLKIFDSGDTNNSIIHKLLDAAGYDVTADIAAGGDAPDDITTTIAHVAATADEESWWELIDDILHFHCYVMRWTGEGKYTHVDWASTTISTGHTFLNDLATRPAMSITKKQNDFDGVEVEWALLDTLSDARLWQMNAPMDGDGNFSGESIAAGSEFPLGADTEDTYQHYEQRWLDLPPTPAADAYSGNLPGRPRKKLNTVKALDLIATSGHSITDSYDTGITRSVSYEALRAKLYYSNPTGGTLKLYYSYIYGDALFRVALKYSKSLIFAGAKKLAGITASHVYTEAVASKYAQAMANNIEYGDFVYDWWSDAEVDVGSLAAIQYTDPINSRTINTAVMVTSKRKAKHFPLYHYEGYGITAYSLGTIAKRGVYPILKSQLDYLLQLRTSNGVTKRVGKGAFVDYLTDDAADQVQINAAILAVSTAGGGVVELVGDLEFLTTAAIEGKSNVILRGNGATIKKNCNDYGLEVVGSDGSEVDGFRIENLTLTRDAADTNANVLLYLYYADGTTIDGVTIDDGKASGIYAYFCDDLKIINCRILDCAGHGMYLRNCTGGQVANNTVRSPNTALRVTGAIGIYLRNSDGAMALGNVVREMHGTGYVIGIEIGGAGRMRVSNNQIADIRGELSDSIGIYAASDDDVIDNNTIQDVSDLGVGVGYGIYIASGIDRCQVKSNQCLANGNLIDRGNCESATSPLFAGETVKMGHTNGTWARSDVDKYEGTYSWLMTKTSAAGAGSASQYLSDTNVTNDMHGLVAGLKYAVWYMGKVPSAGTISRYSLVFQEYHTAAWHVLGTLEMSEVNAWEEVTDDFTLNAGTTGVRMYVYINTDEAVDSLFRIDNLRIQPLGVGNDHVQQYSDAGTDTYALGNSWQGP